MSFHRTILALVVIAAIAPVACGSSQQPPRGSIGDPCERQSDCAGDCIPPNDEFPGGMCTTECIEAPCPDGAVCLPHGDFDICFPGCGRPDDCREGYGCGAAGACVPCALEPTACDPGPDADATDVEPDADAEEEADAGPDEPGEAEVHVEPRENGEPCDRDADCRSRLCLPPALGGVCAAACRPGDICSGSTSCVPFARDGDGDGRTESAAYGCAPWAPGAGYPGMICSTDADCRSLLCRGGVCTVLCRDDSGCDPMTTCSPYPLPTDAGAASFPACALTPVTDARIAEVPLPTQTIPSGAEGRLTRFWAPPGAVSLTVIARQRGAVGGYVGVLNAHDPAGERIYDYDDFAAGRDTPNWHIPDSRIGSLFIPISDRVTFRPGRYMYTPVFFPPDRTTVITDDIEFTALVKFDPGGAVAGRLSANFIFANPDAVNAATARTNARFQAALTEWQAIFGAAGITVSGFTYTDLPAAAAATYRVVDYGADIDTGEVGPLMAQSAGRTEWSVNVFFINDFSGWPLLGIAGGVPGPSAVHGTTHSGVIVCLDCAWRAGGAFLGQVIAHEVGHYLGLFHSTENTGSTGYPYGGDPIADTREGDASNLMYWEARGGRSLSAGQGWVIRRSPTVLPP